MVSRRRVGKKFKRRAPRSRVYRRRNYVRNKSGFVRIVRKTGEIFIQNTATAGVIQVNDTTGSCLNVSTLATSTGFANTWDIPFAMKFSLSQILNHTDLTGLCDRYMIKKTKIRIYFNSNTNSVQSSSSLPQITYMTDNDDASIPTSAQVREKMGCKIRYFNNRNYCILTVYPRANNEVYNTGVSTAYAPGKQMWIDCANPNVEHYGLKGVLQNVNLTTTAFQVGFKFDVEHTIYGKDIQ